MLRRIARWTRPRPLDRNLEAPWTRYSIWGWWMCTRGPRGSALSTNSTSSARSEVENPPSRRANAVVAANGTPIVSTENRRRSGKGSGRLRIFRRWPASVISQ